MSKRIREAIALKSDCCVTYLPSSAKVVTLSGDYSDEFAIFWMTHCPPALFKQWQGFLPGAQPPWRRPSGRARFLREGVLRTDIGPRLQRNEGLGRGAERIALPGQLRQFRQRIALAAHIHVCTAIMVGVGRKRSVLIRISHREDASLWRQRTH